MSDIVKHQGFAPIQSMADFFQLAEQFERSGMFGLDRPGQGAVLLSTCISEGISPIEFKRTYHIIEGMPTMRADRMLAEFRKKGGKYKIITFSPTKAEGTFSYAENEVTMAVTYEDAEKAGWPRNKKGEVKTNWRQTPDAMLWARLVSKVVRTIAPEVVSGVYTPEEVQDFDSSVPQAKAGIDNAIRVNPGEVRFPGQPVTAEPEVIDAETTVEVDGSVCPIGKTAGKKWSELDDNVLAYFADPKHPQVKEAMLQEHRLAVHEELKKRGIKK
jgi:hypothetical protein